jgi:hypothetical protein
MISSLCLSMIFSENRFPLFRIMLSRKPIRADTIGAGSSGQAGHPNHPWLANRSRPCSPPPGNRDFPLHACSSHSRVPRTGRDGRSCARRKREQSGQKRGQQHHLEMQFLTFVSPLGVPRARCPIRNANSGSDLGSRKASNGCDDLRNHTPALVMPMAKEGRSVFDFRSNFPSLPVQMEVAARVRAGLPAAALPLDLS